MNWIHLFPSQLFFHYLFPTTRKEKMSNSPPTFESYLVVGGCGFLGRHIVEQLLGRGETQVSVFDIVQRHFDS